MTYGRVERSDDSIINGEWHYCEDCKTRWSDSDGGCECVVCVVCDKPYDPDKQARSTKDTCADCVAQAAFDLAEEIGI